MMGSLGGAICTVGVHAVNTHAPKIVTNISFTILCICN